MSYIFKDCELLETLSYKYNEMQKLKDISSDGTDVKFIDNEYKRTNINIKIDTDESESNNYSSIMPTIKIESKTDLSLSIKELTKRNINLSYMFSNCNSLIFIPDISIWKINNSDDMVNMSYMFSNCNSLLFLPDISKWNTNNVINISNIFSGCKSIISLPDISKWYLKNVNDLSHLFSNCEN